MESPDTLERENVGQSQEVAVTSIHGLYHHALQRFGKMTKRHDCERCIDSSFHDSIKRCLSLLYMWAQGLDLMFLQNNVSRNTGLQSMVVSELAAIVSIVDQSLNDSDPISRGIISFVDGFTNEDTDNSSSTSDDSDQDATSEGYKVETLHANHIRQLSRLKTHVRCLMDLVPTIENCCSEQRSESIHEAVAVSSQDNMINHVIRPYVMQVQDKFTLIDYALAKRLGEANWARYQRLQNLKKTFMRERDSSGEDDDDGGKEDIGDDDQSRNDATIVRPFSEFFDSGLGASVPARSRYTPSVVSHTSLLSTQSAVHRGCLRVPPTPAEVTQGLPFICQICGVKVSKIRNRIDWKLHVFADIRPYICTFTNCPATKTPFSTRKQWAFHEVQEHRKIVVWRCFRCGIDHDTTAELMHHLEDAHTHKVAESSPEAIAITHAARTLVTRTANQTCPMCRKSGFKDERDWTSHVARHMEEVALIVLPSYPDSDDDDDDDMENEDMLSSHEVHQLAGERGFVIDAVEPVRSIAQTKEATESASNNIATHPAAPPTNKIRTKLHQLAPSLPSYMLARISEAQAERWIELLSASTKHSQDVQHQCILGQELEASSEGEDDNGQLYQSVLPELFHPGIPLPPVERLPAKFECPFCFKVKKFKKPSDWYKHLYEDFAPYHCTFHNCSRLQPFRHKAGWESHEKQQHHRRRLWHCTMAACDLVFYHSDAMAQHLVITHKIADSRTGFERVRSAQGSSQERYDRFWNLVESYRKEKLEIPNDHPCVFCGKIHTTWSRRSRHLAEHMEQLGTLVLNFLEKETQDVIGASARTTSLTQVEILQGKAEETSDAVSVLSSPPASPRAAYEECKTISTPPTLPKLGGSAVENLNLTYHDENSRSRLAPQPTPGDNVNQCEDEDNTGDHKQYKTTLKRQKDVASPERPLSPRFFACPFFKHDPDRFSSRNFVEKGYRGCDAHFLTDVSRVKQHLKRVHWQPETFCPRCYQEFDNSTALSKHTRSEPVCLLRDCPFPEKMSKRKQVEIHIKRPRVAPETVWYDIFKVLFPTSVLPQSPYVEQDIYPARTFTTIRGQQVDITGLDIDSEYLEHLPEDLREEVIRRLELENSSHGSNQRF